MTKDDLAPSLRALLTRLEDIHPDDCPPSLRSLRRQWVDLDRPILREQEVRAAARGVVMIRPVDEVRIMLDRIERERDKAAAQHHTDRVARLDGGRAGILWLANIIGLDRGDMGLLAEMPIERAPMPGERGSASR